MAALNDTTVFYKGIDSKVVDVDNAVIVLNREILVGNKGTNLRDDYIGN